MRKRLLINLLWFSLGLLLAASMVAEFWAFNRFMELCTSTLSRNECYDRYHDDQGWHPNDR